MNADLSIAYVDAGAGDTLVFIHGSLCDYRYWAPQLTGLSHRFHVVAPSLCHYYPRLPSMAAAQFGWQIHVAQMCAFIRHQFTKPVHIIGHSRGAAIAYRVALQMPALAGHLTLVDPAGPGSAETPEIALHFSELHAIRTQAVQLIADGSIDEGLRLFVDSTSRPGFWDRSAPVFQNMARDNAGTLAPQLAERLPVYRKEDAVSLSCPALLVDGLRSPDRYRRNARMLAQWIPGARHVTIAGASHGMTWSHAAAFGDELIAFTG